jgi:hypothetical protein
MKAIYPLTLISIFALCTFFSGCASTDSPSKTTATKKNNQAVVVNNNTLPFPLLKQHQQKCRMIRQ